MPLTRQEQTVMLCGACALKVLGPSDCMICVEVDMSSTDLDAYYWLASTEVAY